MRTLALATAVLALVFAPNADTRLAAQTPPRTWQERTINLPIVGPSMAYVPRAPTDRVVLFVSGDGGWNLGVVDMARRIAPDAIVVGISFPKLSHAAPGRSGCWYPAGDLETLSHAAQKRLGLTDYHAPVLVGYSSGATLVYAALAAAPPTTFAGGVSLGFCADLDIARPVCRAAGWSPTYDEKKHLSWLPAVKALPRPWYVLHGKQDQVCAPEQVRAFVSSIGNAHLVELDGTGHGFGKPAHWAQPFDDALDAIWRSAPGAHPKPAPANFAATEQRLVTLGLPLEYRWPRVDASAWILFFSGDGGWASLDEAVAQDLAQRDIAVVGVSSLRYFWREKPPGQVAADLRRLISVVGRPVFLGGYSFGAEVVPVALRDWPAADRSTIEGLALVAPGPSASFEIDPLDWLRTPPEDPATRVAPAVRELRLPTLCVQGSEDTESACGALPNAPPFHVVRLPGSHHFDGNYAAVGDTIAVFIQESRGRLHPAKFVAQAGADAPRRVVTPEPMSITRR
jgi:type IV secretory pathway VirJ component